MKEINRRPLEENLSQSEDESETNSIDGASSDEEFQILSDNEFETNMNISDEESEEEPPSSFISKDGKLTWYKNPDRSWVGRKSEENVISTPPGPTLYAVNRVSDIESSFELFMTKGMQDIIINMTNIEGRCHLFYLICFKLHTLHIFYFYVLVYLEHFVSKK